MSKKKPKVDRVVVMGASAGGVEALTQIVSQFPPDFQAAVLIAVHVPESATSVLPRILTRSGDLQAFHVFDQEPMERGVIYVAPPGRHLIAHRGSVTAVFGPRENGHRPAIDPLFRSAATVYEHNVIGVVLSGNMDDGTSGLAAIKQTGGIAIVQDPQDATNKGMTRIAVENVAVDFVLPLSEIGQKIVELVNAPAPDGAEEADMKDDIGKEVQSARFDPRLIGVEPDGEPSGYTCPECNGGLWEVVEGKLVRFRCRVGHAYTADSLLSASGSQVEAALWAALRALEENAAYAGRLAKRAKSMNNETAAKRFEDQSGRASEHAITLRKVLLSAPELEIDEPLNVGMSNQEI